MATFYHGAFYSGTFFVDSSTPSITVDAGSSISGGSFSRGRWHSLKAAIEAEHEAERKAKELKDSKRKRKLAAQAAAILREAREHAELASESERIDTAVAELADAANKVALTVHGIKELRRKADQIVVMAEDDEEEAIALILATLH